MQLHTAPVRAIRCSCHVSADGDLVYSREANMDLTIGEILYYEWAGQSTLCELP